MASFSPTAGVTATDGSGPLNFTGDAPGSTPVQLAGVFFRTSEAPETFPIGAVEQMVVVTTLPGGTRVIAAFGPSPKPVSWSGKLYGTNITPRIKQLRLLAVSGVPVTLTWGSESYLVVVKEFTPTQYAGYAGYDISVEIAHDLNGAFSIATSTSIDQQIDALESQIDQLNPIIQALDPLGSAALQTPISNLKAAVQAAKPISQNIVSAALTVLPAVQSAVAAVKGYASGQSPISNLFASATQMQSAMTNIGLNVSRGQSAIGVSVQGGSLFDLASQQYGDVTQAFSLATANGISSPFLSAAQQTFVALPPFLGK